MKTKLIRPSTSEIFRQTPKVIIFTDREQKHSKLQIKKIRDTNHPHKSVKLLIISWNTILITKLAYYRITPNIKAYSHNNHLLNNPLISLEKKLPLQQITKE